MSDLYNISMTVAGEPGTTSALGKLSTNGVKSGTIKTLNINDDSVWNTTLTFCSSLTDRAGNKSASRCFSVQTPVRPIRPGECDWNDERQKSYDELIIGNNQNDSTMVADKLGYSLSCKVYAVDKINSQLESAQNNYLVKVKSVDDCVTKEVQNNNLKSGDDVLSNCGAGKVLGVDSYSKLKEQIDTNVQSNRAIIEKQAEDARNKALIAGGTALVCGVAAIFTAGTAALVCLGVAAVATANEAANYYSAQTTLDTGILTDVKASALTNLGMNNDLAKNISSGINSFSNGVVAAISTVGDLAKSVVDLSGHVNAISVAGVQTLADLFTDKKDSPGLMGHYDQYKEGLKENGWDLGNVADDAFKVAVGTIVIAATIATAGAAGGFVSGLAAASTIPAIVTSATTLGVATSIISGLLIGNVLGAGATELSLQTGAGQFDNYDQICARGAESDEITYAKICTDGEFDYEKFQGSDLRRNYNSEDLAQQLCGSEPANFINCVAYQTGMIATGYGIGGVAKELPILGQIIKAGEDLGKSAYGFGQDQAFKVTYQKIYIKQLEIVSTYKDIIADCTTLQKGNYGEIVTNIDLIKKGYRPLSKPITDINEPTHQGIDGVYVKNGEYIIVEEKYGTARLDAGDGMTPKQMSDAWIQGNNRLVKVLNGNENNINAIRNLGYKRILARVSSDGTIIYLELDPSANIIGNIDLTK
jgi:hypothetical protein